MNLTADLIYEAALDDQLFAELPSIVARALEARSCVLHWRDQSGAAEIFTHSGYFSDDHMADYAANFAVHDLWTEAGMRDGRVNRAWNTSELVAEGEYQRSIFYNEWIRGMGDDTFYCCGSVMRTVHGDGIIGLHRGRSQADFSPQALRQLNRHVDHLRRMLAIRGQMSSLTKQRDLARDIWDSARSAALVIGSGSRVMMGNSAGDALLRSGRFLRSRNGCVGPVVDNDAEPFGLAVAAALDPQERRASDILLRARDGSVAVASVVPMVSSVAPPSVLVTIAEPKQPLPRDAVQGHLKREYGLTDAEADVALRLADGETISSISDARQSVTSTVRTQVKEIFSKMGAKRQADVVRAVVAAYFQP